MTKMSLAVALAAGLLFPTAVLARGQIKPAQTVVPVAIVQADDDDDDDCREVTTTDESGRTITQTVCD